ncbi:MAG: NAD(P)H-hydrate dehydratase [Dissulfurimicrobium sp.]|uniref:NAD(P)H-hydrate dehydratase n=2 Tax=Dissulfurimicrobium TaxID=1769732 RepID=UPI003D0FAE0E
MLLATSKEMQVIDQSAAKDFAIPSLILMENAGRGATDLILRNYKERLARGVVILVGPGSNGGDGLVIARSLFQQGVKTEIFAFCREFKGDSGVNYQIVKAFGIPIKWCLDEGDLPDLKDAAEDAGVIVDALFGTGLNRPLSGVFEVAVELVNASEAPVVSVDMPSGLSSDTGRPIGPVIMADMTVTMALPKLGQVIYPGVDYVGGLEVIDIGIPKAAVRKAGIKTLLLDREFVTETLRPRPPEGHKGTFGHVLVIAGSRGKSGAACLSALGALRAGAGLVTVACPVGIQPIVAQGLKEAMTEGLEEGDDGSVSANALARLESLLAGKKAAVIGPGLGLGDDVRQFMCEIIRTAPVPMVVDADALTAVGADHEILMNARGPRVITPHPGEAARLLGCTSADVQRDRVAAVKMLSERSRAIAVLKGARTIISAPDGRLAVNPTGNPGMAAGGMGDILGGIIGAFLAQGYSPWDAALLGVFLHGQAADRVAEKKGPFGYLASEVAEELPGVFREYINGRIHHC